MKILILTNTYPSRSQTFIRNHVEGLAEKGHDVTVLAKNGKKADSSVPVKTPVKIIYFGLGNRKIVFSRIIFSLSKAFFLQPGRFWKTIGFLIKTGDYSVLRSIMAADALRGKSFDVIHGQFGPLGNLALLLKSFNREMGVAATSFRGSDISSHLKKYPRIYRILKEKGDLFLPVTSAFLPILKNLGFPDEKIRVYYSAIDMNAFPFRARSINDCINLLCVGRLVEKKGFQYALDVVSLLRERYPAIRLRIVGDGPLRETLSHMAREKGILDYIDFAGWKTPEETAHIMGESHVLLGTSIVSESGDIEGIPNVLKEAMASGCPVVAFNHSGISDLIEDERSGFIVKTGSSELMAEKVGYVLDHYNDSIREVVKAACRRIAEKFDRSVQAGLAEKNYRDAIENNRK